MDPKGQMEKEDPALIRDGSGVGVWLLALFTSMKKMTSFSIILFISPCSKFIRNRLLSVKSCIGGGEQNPVPHPQTQSQVSPIRGPES